MLPILSSFSLATRAYLQNMPGWNFTGSQLSRPVSAAHLPDLDMHQVKEASRLAEDQLGENVEKVVLADFGR